MTKRTGNPYTESTWSDGNLEATITAIGQLRYMSEKNLQQLEAAIRVVRGVREEMETIALFEMNKE